MSGSIWLVCPQDGPMSPVYHAETVSECQEYMHNHLLDGPDWVVRQGTPEEALVYEDVLGEFSGTVKDCLETLADRTNEPLLEIALRAQEDGVDAIWDAYIGPMLDDMQAAYCELPPQKPQED